MNTIFELKKYIINSIARLRSIIMNVNFVLTLFVFQSCET